MATTYAGFGLQFGKQAVRLFVGRVEDFESSWLFFLAVKQLSAQLEKERVTRRDQKIDATGRAGQALQLTWVHLR